MSRRWDCVPIEQVATRVERPERLDSTKTYRLLGAHWYAKGLYVKDEKPGAEIRASRLFAVRAGDFVYNRLFAWKGSFAVAQAEHDGCFVSGEFPCFQLAPERVSARFLWLYFSRDTAWQEAFGLSTGSTPTSRNRLKEEQFLAMQVPLPPLDEQRRIVSRIEELAALIQEAQELRGKARQEAGALFTAALSELYGMPEERGRQTRTLGELSTDVRYGLTAKASTEPVGPILLRITDIDDDGRVSYDSPKYVAVSDEEYERFKLSAGDIVIARSGSVGKSHLFTRSEGVVFASYLIRFRPRRDIVMPEYLQLTLRSSAFSDFVDRQKTVSAQPNVSASKLKKFLVPLPDLPEQSRVVAHVARLQEEVHKLTHLQAATQTELDDLLPSVLGRAFKGDL